MRRSVAMADTSSPPLPVPAPRRLVRNAGAGERAGVAPLRDAIALHRQLPGYAPTPVWALPELAARLGVRAAWVKDETRRFGLSSFKIVGASWAAFRAVCSALALEPAATPLARLRTLLSEHPDVELVTASAGNHGEAVAAVATLLGIPAHVLLPAATAVQRVAAIEAAGGVVTLVDGTYDDAVAQAAALAGERRLLIADVAHTPGDLAPRDVVDGYETILSECDEQLVDAGPIDAVFVPAGVGSLAAAVVRHVTAPGAPAWASGAAVIVVEPASASCVGASLEAGRLVAVPADEPTSMAGMNCGRPSTVVWDELRAGVSAVLTVLDEDADLGAAALAAEGIGAGPCAGAGPGAALALAGGLIDPDGLRALGLSSDSSALFLATEGVRVEGAAVTDHGRKATA